jgi:hypothetical protein
VADRITATVEHLGHQIDTVKVNGDQDLDLLGYDFVFVGSGVYQWLPGKGLQEFIAARRFAGSAWRCSRRLLGTLGAQAVPQRFSSLTIISTSWRRRVIRGGTLQEISV